MTSTAVVDDAHHPRPRPRRRLRDGWLVLLLAVLLVAAWMLGRSQLFKSGDDLSYWIAVVGGSMMLLLMLYPVRKYVPALRNLGRVKSWFWMHMSFGIAGPWLILVHSTFHIGSLNAGVALYSMLVVVASGVVGRFIYVRVHRGLDGEITTLRELQQRAGFVESDARSKLSFAPQLELELLAFERRQLRRDAGAIAQLRQVLWLPAQQWLVQRRCERLLDAALVPIANASHWNDVDLERHRRQAGKLVRRYLEAVVRVAQFTAYERVFALWHVAHMPFVVLLIVSAVVHVVAVHAY